MRTSTTLNGGVRNYVSILPALFPAIVFLMIGLKPLPLRINNTKIGVTPLIERVREIYTSQIGVREKPSNSGPRVEKYLKYVHLSKGNPWCAAFVCWVLGEAGVENPRSGWSPALFGKDKIVWARGERGKVKGERSGVLYNKDVFASAARESLTGIPGSYPPRPTTHYRPLITNSSPIKTLLANPPTPTTGDIFGLYFPEKGRTAHVGFIDQWDGTWMISVEGNTNIAGSREGDGVYRKRRLVRSVYQVARYITR